MNNNILLSICIPTYNRAEILKISLSRLIVEVNKVDDKSKIEIFVSDNCSTDNTKNIVNNFIDQGACIKYSRNNVNVGSNGNFLKCIEMASGKYIWLLGDDDPLTNDSIKMILDIIEYDDYGLIHINNRATKNKNNIVYNDKEQFLQYVSLWITFMSANIFRSEIVEKIDKPEQYLNTWLVQVPFFISSALSKEKNIVVYDKILGTPLASVTNGGYNIFEVFGTSFLTIMRDFYDSGKLSKKSYNIEYQASKNFILPYVLRLLICKRKSNFIINNAWSSIYKTFGFWNFWFSMIIYLFKHTFKRVCHVKNKFA